jgi:threonylcarbamoyladenosine tRNA methylthiotransferase MtaB
VRTFLIVTLGCKVNQCESQLLREQLVALGLAPAQEGDTADLCIVNTCAVTATAQGKSVRAMRKLVREHPGARVAAMGCGVNASPERYSAAEMLIRQEDKERAAQILTGCESPLGTTSAFAGHSRAFLKIQDGCDSFCSYCIVPYLRGKPRSKRPDIIEREARAIARSGYRELVLAGIHLGHYGRDLGGGICLADVVEVILEADLFPRLRLSGVEVNEVDERLMKLVAGENALCPHLHIPLQSGSAEVLADMGRKYTPEQYLEVVEKVRDAAPRVSITTDVIAGFPTEEPRHFQQTIDTCRKAGFSRMHVFPYSRRKGTAAAKKWNTADTGESKRRSQVLREVAGELARSYAEQFVGENVRILVESRISTGSAEGYTDHYIKGRMEGAGLEPGQLVEGRVSASRAGVLSIEAPVGASGRGR